MRLGNLDLLKAPDESIYFVRNVQQRRFHLISKEEADFLMQLYSTGKALTSRRRILSNLKSIRLYRKFSHLGLFSSADTSESHVSNSLA
ncbi:MAG: hypothetical protein FWG10_09040 [Eubacteriaceae bacterium]|nr:hypothetical protein [Eubacteriaceae bacterium]